MEPYEYQPLPSPTSIRLIKLKIDDKTDDLVCSFEIADILVPQVYIALSYVWGDTSSTVTIICHGKPIQVTQNLQAVLRSFAHLPTLIWADALSVNQQNILEKTQQVNMMASIYSKAAKVAIWLGLDPHNDAADVFEDINALIDLLGGIHNMGGEFNYFDKSTGDLYWKLPSGASVASALPAALVTPDEEEKARLKRFFRLPWFSRTWVIQECGLAYEAFVVWGHLTIFWNRIGVAALFLLRHFRAHLNSLNLSPDVEKVRDLYTTFSPFVPRTTFFHVLNTTRRYKATDARDKVFALLSHPTACTISIVSAAPPNASAFELYRELATQFLPSVHDKWLVKHMAQQRQGSSTKSASSQQPLMKADYSKTTEEIYLGLARDHIERTGTLEILNAVQHDPKSTSNLVRPSWVPRWDYFVDTPVLGLYTSDHFASANRSAIITAPLNDDPNTLIVRGTLISRIVSHTKLLTSSDFDLSLPSTDTLGPESSLVQDLWTSNPVASTWLASGLAHRHEEGHEYPQILAPLAGSSFAVISKASRLGDAYLRSWVFGKAMGEVDSFDFKADSGAYWDRLFWGTLGNPKCPVENRTSSNEEVRWKRYRDCAAEVCNQRKFFFTRKGFFGVGPGALKENDWVAVLLGSDAPFVIREADPDARDPTVGEVPQDTKFHLVGECYLDGLMQGQAVRGKEIKRNIILV